MRELTEQQKRELEHLANIRDEEIDLTEMPEITDFIEFERGLFSAILQRRRERIHSLKSSLPAATPAPTKRIT
jgi:hypothetical protein